VPFKDIFIIQILGMLINREFSGDVSFIINGNKNNAANIRFNQGSVVSLFYCDLANAQALKAIAWNNEGELKLFPQPVIEDPLDYYHIVEDFIKEDVLLPNSDNIMLMNIFVTRTELKSIKNSPWSINGLNILEQIGSESKLIDISKGEMSDQDFWNSFWYISCHGLLVSSYANFIGVFLQQFQDNLIQRMKKLMGSHIAKAYTAKLWENLQNQWPDWNKDKAPDPIYGSYPYQIWAQAIQETAKQVGTLALQKRCFDSTLSNIPAENSWLITLFFNPSKQW
jgi:hypothetical protein